MRKIKSAVLAALLASCGWVHADVLEKLPAGALVAGRVANLTATSNKVAKLAKDLGIDAFVAQLQNPLANLKTQSHIEKGINDAGELGFAYLDAKSMGLKEEDAFVILVPVSNYQEFLSNFTAPKTDGAVSEVNPPDGSGGPPMFVADWDGYAAMSPAKTMVAKPTATMKPVDAAAKESARQDFLIVANFKELGPKLLPELDKGMAEATKDLEQNGKNLDAKYQPLVKAALTQAFAMGKTFLNTADAATIGLNISDAGINTTVMSDFKPDSYLGKVAMGMKGTDKPLTVGLPQLKYLAYGGMTIDSATFSQVFDDVTTPVMDELQKVQGIDDAKKLAATATAAVKKLKGTTFGMPVPAAIGKEALLQQVAIYHGGAADFKTLFTDGGAVAKKLVADMKLPPDRPKPMVEQTMNVKTIEGIGFDRIHIDMKPNPDAPGAAQQEQMLSVFYGPEGLNYQYGASGDDFFVVNGATDETVAAFVKANKAGEDTISKLDQVKVVAAELPKTRSLEYFVALDEMVNTGVSTAAQFGLPIQIQLPPDLPPLGVTFGGDGSSIRIDTHLPTTTVQSLIAAGMQAYMGMRGGGGGNL